MRLYILDADKRPVAVPDTMEWAAWHAAHQRELTVAYSEVGGVKVSTVFLGIDTFPGWLRDGGEPLLWETMIFGGENHHYQARYASHAEAVTGHAEAETLARQGRPR